MPSKIEKIQGTMFKRADPVIFRGAAYLAVIGVVATDQLLGGAWWAIPVAMLLVAVINFILPANAPRDILRKGILAAFRTIRCSPLPLRLACAVLMVVGVAILDYYAGGLKLGREFNIYLIPIFLSSLLFGFPVAVLTWIVSFVAVYYFVIPPRDSFEIGSLKDFADLISYFHLGLITLAIPVLIRASSVADADH